MKKICLVLIGLFILIISMNITYASDVLLWQGQYYTGTRFNTGIYEFNFSVYDALIEGDICYSNATNLTTGNFGEWKTEQYNVSSSCNNASKDYYLNINIGGIDQTPRKRLIIWNFLRKDVDEITSGKIQTNAQVIAPIIKADAQIMAPIINATQVVADELNITGNVNILGILRGHSPLRIGDSIQFVDTNGSNLFSLYTSGQNITGNNVSSQYSGVIIHQIETHTNPSGIEECWWDREDQEMRMCMDKTNIEMWNNLIVNKNINATENITASYFIGDGRFLTNVPINESETDPIWTANYSTFLTHITWANAMNGTLLKTSDWNSTNTSYYLVSNPYNYYNSTTLPVGVGETDPMWTSNSSNVARTGNCPAGQIVQNTTTSGVQCIVLPTSTSSYWNRTGITLIPSTPGDNINTTGIIRGNYYSVSGVQGITNTTGYSVCIEFQGQNCKSWCTLQINNGIITGCS